MLGLNEGSCYLKNGSRSDSITFISISFINFESSHAAVGIASHRFSLDSFSIHFTYILMMNLEFSIERITSGAGGGIKFKRLMCI